MTGSDAMAVTSDALGGDLGARDFCHGRLNIPARVVSIRVAVVWLCSSRYVSEMEYVSCYAGRMLKGYSEFGEPYGGKVRTRLGGDGGELGRRKSLGMVYPRALQRAVCLSGPCYSG